MKWPFVRRSVYEKVHLENYTLRDALREANMELRKYKTLVSAWKQETDKATLAKFRQMYHF